MVTKRAVKAPPRAALGPAIDKPINVLLLGETAHGKSTLIRRLGIYSGQESPNVQIGNGNESCTKTVAPHSISTNLRSYSLVDRQGKPIRRSDYDDLLELDWEDAGQAEGMPDEDGKVFRFDFFDTPGLDDSDGNDMTIMADIVRSMTALPHLNAIIYVRSMDQPFGRTFRTMYDYLQRSMPMICNGLIVVHSRFTTSKISEAMERGVDLAADRRRAFMAATGGHHSNAHFFMDNEPDAYSPFASVQSFNGCYSLLKLLSKQRPLDISSTRLVKVPYMKNLDDKVATVLSNAQARLMRDLDSKMADASNAKQKLESAKRQATKCRRRLDQCEADLAGLDSDNEVVLGTRTVEEEYSFIEHLLLEQTFRLPTQTVVFDAPCLISHVETSAGPNSRWMSEERTDRRWKAKLKSGLIKNMAGSATFYATSREKHSGKIAELRKRCEELEDSLQDHEHIIKAETGDGVKVDADIERLAGELEKVEEMKEKVEQEAFDAALWPDLKRLYTSKSPLGLTEVVEFLKVHDPAASQLLSGKDL